MSATCNECSAVVENLSRHRNWHYDIDRKLKQAADDARRAKRNSG